jgi:hypothetical protein
MPQTYDKLAAVTVGTAGTTFLVMDSIPSTYTDLVLVINGSSASNSQLGMRFNNLSNLYSITTFGGQGSVAQSGKNNALSAALGLDFYFSFSTTASAGTIIANILNYSNSTTHKPVLVRANNAGQGLSATAGIFANTSAISRIDVFSQSGINLSVGTTFTLYGIKAA